MVPDVRTWFRGLVRPFRERRWLALLAGIVSGASALAAATRYAHLSFYEWLLLPLGFGGFVYYVAHYEAANWREEKKLRSFVRYFPMILLASAFAPSDATLSAELVSFCTAYSVLLFVMVSTAVSASENADIEDAVEGDGDRHSMENQPPAAPTRRTADGD